MELTDVQTKEPAADPHAGCPGHAPSIRVANKALIIRDGALLVTTNHGEREQFYLLPGGGQEWGEDAITGLRRELREEIGCEVIVDGVACIRDYVGKNHDFAQWDGWFHQQETLWFCHLPDGVEPCVTGTGDVYQTGFSWLPLDQLVDTPLWPKAVASWLQLPADERPLYLGDVN